MGKTTTSLPHPHSREKRCLRGPVPVGMVHFMNPWPEVKGLLAGARSAAYERRWRLVLAIVVMMMGVGLLLPHDWKWNRWLVTDRQDSWLGLAKQLSFWGDYPIGILLPCTTIWVLGWWRERPQWRTVALATLLAASFAGAEASLVRFVTGRPRPNTKVADRLHGPSLNRDYASFPSAHTAAAFGAAGALLGVTPPVGVPVLIGAAGVGWSRLYKGVHYPSDVWAGAWLGLVNGLVFAVAARRLLRPIVQS